MASRSGKSAGPMESVSLEVYVQPRASKTELAGLHDGRLGRGA